MSLGSPPTSTLADLAHVFFVKSLGSSQEISDLNGVVANHLQAYILRQSDESQIRMECMIRLELPRVRVSYVFVPDISPVHLMAINHLSSRPPTRSRPVAMPVALWSCLPVTLPRTTTNKGPWSALKISLYPSLGYPNSPRSALPQVRVLNPLKPSAHYLKPPY